MDTPMAAHIKKLTKQRKEGDRFKLSESADPDAKRSALREAVDKAWPFPVKKDDGKGKDTCCGLSGGYTHVITPGDAGKGIVERDGQKYGVVYQRDIGTGKIVVSSIIPVGMEYSQIGEPVKLS